MHSPGERLQAASKPLDQIVMAITKCLNAGADGELVHSGAESGEAVSPAARADFVAASNSKP